MADNRPDSPDLVIAKRLLDHAKAKGFTFQRITEGPDGPLVGSRETDTWADTVYLAGFSGDCFATRERVTSLIVPGAFLMERRVTGSALNVLNAVLTWETDTTPMTPRPSE